MEIPEVQVLMILYQVVEEELELLVDMETVVTVVHGLEIVQPMLEVVADHVRAAHLLEQEVLVVAVQEQLV